MHGALDPQELRDANAKVSRAWAKEAKSYDRRIGFFERRIFGEEHRPWACSRATGRTLEVAVGTGLNLPFYPPDVELTGLDLTPEMLRIAAERSAHLGMTVDLREGDAHSLPFEDATFDSVVCTYSLCGIPDPARAIGEMDRVLRPGGRLLLVDHIGSSVRPVYWVQRGVEAITIRTQGEHMTRRQLPLVQGAGFEVLERDRLRWGVIERISARKSA